MKSLMSVALSYLLLLTACGGGGSATPAAAATACAPTVIQIEGDSISVGVGATDPANRPLPLLRAAFPSATVLDTGLAGSTSSDRMTGATIQGQGTAFAPFPAGVKGTVYVTEFGVNDAWYGLPVADFKANVRRLAAVPGAVLATPTPIDLARASPRPESVPTAAYAQAVREVAAEAGVPLADVQAYVLAQPNWQVLLVDGVHPSDALYRMIYASAMVPAIQQAICR